VHGPQERPQHTSPSASAHPTIMMMSLLMMSSLMLFLHCITPFLPSGEMYTPQMLHQKISDRTQQLVLATIKKNLLGHVMYEYNIGKIKQKTCGPVWIKLYTYVHHQFVVLYM